MSSSSLIFDSVAYDPYRMSTERKAAWLFLLGSVGFVTGSALGLIYGYDHLENWLFMVGTGPFVLAAAVELNDEFVSVWRRARRAGATFWSIPAGTDRRAAKSLAILLVGCLWFQVTTVQATLHPQRWYETILGLWSSSLAGSIGFVWASARDHWADTGRYHTVHPVEFISLASAWFLVGSWAFLIASSLGLAAEFGLLIPPESTAIAGIVAAGSTCFLIGSILWCRASLPFDGYRPTGGWNISDTSDASR